MRTQSGQLMLIRRSWQAGGIRKLRLLTALVIVAIGGGCAWGEAIQTKIHGENNGSIIPTFRYVEDHEGEIRYEDISDSSVEVVYKAEALPIASGPMNVDCGSVLELGIVVRRGEFSRSGYWHDYDFKLTQLDPALSESRPFVFEKYLRRSFLKGAVRFRGPLRNGSLTISVTHRKEILYSTDFMITGCE